MRCDCCASVMGRAPRQAVARWTTQAGHVERLCQACLDIWLDNADDDPTLEPGAWAWLPGHAPPALADVR